MRAGDLLRESIDALRASRTRTALTGLGITVGTLALALILSLSLGLSNVVDDLVQSDEQLRHVVVMPGFGSRVKRGDVPDVVGEMSEEKRARLKRTLTKRSRGGPSFQMRTNPITAEVEEQLTLMPQAENVRPFLQDRFEATLLGGDPPLELDRDVLSLGMPAKHPHYPGRVLAGTWFDDDAQQGVVVHELLLYDLGFTSDEAQAAVVGRKLRLLARRRASGGMMEVLMGTSLKAQRKNAEELYAIEVPIVGVLRERFGDEPASLVEEMWSMQNDLFLPIDFARELWERTPGRDGPRGLLITAKSLDDVQPLEEEAQALGLRANSVRMAVERVKQALGGATVVATFLAGIAVFVSGLGIVNTMVMSVMERTREIGLLKALGASDRAISALFLAEGALLGLLGGLIGVGLAYLISIGGDEVGRRYIEAQFQMPFGGELFRFPWWLAVGGLGFAIGTSLIASLIPALRAARIDPVRALRHE